MVRDNWVRLSDEEYSNLTDLREEIFETNEVPYGAAVGRLMEKYEMEIMDE